MSSHMHNDHHCCNEGGGEDGNGGSADGDPEMGIRYSLYTQIDKENVQCLNEKEDSSGKMVFKPWEDRLSHVYVQSDVDEELLFNIPFTSSIKLKGIVVIGGQGGEHPSRMKLYKNREFVTFDDTSVQAADLEFEMQPDASGNLEYPIPVVKFSSVTHLAIYFPSNFGDDQTTIYYIGLRGEYSPIKRHGVTICTYEARPMADDHKVERDRATSTYHSGPVA